MRVAHLIALLVLSAPATAAEPCAPIARVHFQRDAGGHMLVAGHLAHRPAWLVIDTGGTISLIAETLARELRLNPKRHTAAIVDAAGTSLTRAVTVPAIALGTKRIAGQTTFLLMQSLGENAIAGGTLALDVLKSFDVAIDNTKQTLTLLPPGRCRPKHAATLPLDASDRGLPLVQGTLDGAPARVLIDTGSTATYVDRAFAKHYFGLTRHSEGVAKAGNLITPTGAELESWSYIFKELQVGPLQFQNVPALIANLPAAEVTLGQAQLQNLNLHFAFAEGRVYVGEAH